MDYYLGSFDRNSDTVLTKFDLALKSAESLLKQVRTERKGSSTPTSYSSLTYSTERSKRLQEQSEIRKKTDSR